MNVMIHFVCVCVVGTLFSADFSVPVRVEKDFRFSFFFGFLLSFCFSSVAWAVFHSFFFLNVKVAARCVLRSHALTSYVRPDGAGIFLSSLDTTFLSFINILRELTHVFGFCSLMRTFFLYGYCLYVCMCACVCECVLVRHRFLLFFSIIFIVSTQRCKRV